MLAGDFVTRSPRQAAPAIEVPDKIYSLVHIDSYNWRCLSIRKSKTMLLRLPPTLAKVRAALVA